MWFFFSFGAAILESVSTVFEKKILNLIGDGRLDLYIASLNGFASLVLLVFFGQRTSDFKTLFFIFLMSIGSCVTYSLVARCLKNSSIGAISPLLLLSPVFSGLLAAIFLNEYLQPVALGGIFLILIGAYYLEAINHKQGFWHISVIVKDKIFVLILTAAFIYGVLSFFDRYILLEKNISPFDYLLWLQLFIGVNMFWVTKIFSKTSLREALSIELDSTTMLLLLSLSLTMFSYRFLQVTATAIAPIMAVLVIKRFSILFSIILSKVFFHEKKLLYKILATSLMIVGAILMIYNQA